MFYADFAMGSIITAGLKHYHALFPTATWFQPAPLLIAMVAHNVTVIQLQKDPSLVLKLMAGENMSGRALSKEVSFDYFVHVAQ